MNDKTFDRKVEQIQSDKLELQLGVNLRKFNFNLKLKLCETFFFIAEYENIIELEKQKIFTMSNFSPYQAFTRMDRTKSNLIKSFDIQKFIRQNILDEEK